MGISEGHFDRAVPQNGLERGEIAGRLKEDAGEAMPEIVSPEREADLPSQPPEVA